MPIKIYNRDWKLFKKKNMRYKKEKEKSIKVYLETVPLDKDLHLIKLFI